VHLRLAKAHDVQKNNVDKHTALVCQHTTRMLLPRVTEYIDNINYENYHVPVLIHSHRKLKERVGYFDSAGAGEYSDKDFVDERTQYTYAEIDLPFRLITDLDECKRLKLINDLFNSAINNKTIPISKFKRALTQQQYESYIESLTKVVEMSEIQYGNGMPGVLHSYIAYVKDADFQFNKYESMSGKRGAGRAVYKSGVVKKTEDKAEKLYELALERLTEIYSSASEAEKFELNSWFDREITIERGTDMTHSIDCVGVPRVKGSKSINGLDTGLPKLSSRLKKRECQLHTLLEAAFHITYDYKYVEEVVELTEEQKLQLNKRLNFLKSMREY
jgi:hypothetical protein